MIATNLENVNGVTTGEVIFNNGDFAIIENITDVRDAIVQLDSEVLVALIVTSGHCSANVNNETTEVNVGDLFVSARNAVLKSMYMSLDFSCHGFLFKREYLRHIIPLINNTWNARLYLENASVWHLPDKVRETFELYCSLLKARIEMYNEKPFTRQVMDSLLSALIFDLGNTFVEKDQLQKREFSSSTNISQRFLELLSKTTPTSRRVDFYADKLCITPKYLSTVCKKATGHTASFIIDEFVSKKISHMLVHTSLSIKEIADELGFPSIYFFGKYVKKNLGLSPRQYRERAVEGL